MCISCVAVLNAVSWHLWSPLGFSALSLHPQLYRKLMSERGQRGVRVGQLILRVSVERRDFNYICVFVCARMCVHTCCSVVYPFIAYISPLPVMEEHCYSPLFQTQYAS